MPKIRILIVEDDPDWRRGLIAYLSREPDLDVCVQAETSEQALQAFAEHEIDVVLMDIMLANSMEGIWLTAEVTQNWGAQVIMLTSLQEKETMLNAFMAGAIDYLLKSDYEKIPQAIRLAHHKKSPISPEAAEQMRAEFRRLKQLEASYKAKELKDLLTPTEVQILQKIDQGMTQNEIAEHFVISLRTVKVHVGNILRKIPAGSSREAAEQARQLGLF